MSILAGIGAAVLLYPVFTSSRTPVPFIDSIKRIIPFLPSGSGLLSPTPVPTGIPGLQIVGHAISSEEADFIPEPTVRQHIVEQSAIKEYTSVSTDLETKVVTTTKIKVTPSGVNKSVTVTKGSERLSDMRIIDGMVYVRNPENGSWWKQSTKTTFDWQGNDVNKLTNLAFTADVKQYEKRGEEECGESICSEYAEVDKDKKTDEYRRTFLVNVETGLLAEERTGVTGFETVTTYSYDPVSIPVPQDAEIIKDNENIFDYYIMYNRFSPN